MKIIMGCDLVHISRFKNMNKKTGEKIFHPREWKNKKPESLAGIFAVKESCKKVFPNLGWHDLEVKTKRNGKPILSINSEKEIYDYDVSISHDGEYAMAVAIFVVP